MRIRIQKYIEHVRRGFGDVGASIVGAFFLYGRMSKSALVRDIIPLLEVEVISLGKDGNKNVITSLLWLSLLILFNASFFLLFHIRWRRGFHYGSAPFRYA